MFVALWLGDVLSDKFLKLASDDSVVADASVALLAGDGYGF